MKQILKISISSFQVNLTIIANIFFVIFLCPYLVTGDASLRGIEYNFIPTERIDTPRFESHNHHEEPVQIATTSHHNIVVPPSRSPIETETNYNDVDYESDSYEPASSTDYYDENADR